MTGGGADMADATAQNQRWRNLTARGVHQFKRLLLMFLYLWAIFGLIVLNQEAILAKHNISYSAEGLHS